MSEFGDRDLTDLLSRITRWWDYAEAQLSLVEIEEGWINEEIEKVSAMELVKMGDQKHVSVAKARVSQNQDIQRMREDLQVVWATKKLMRTIVNSCERDSFAVSRELSRRLGMEPKNRRSHRWGS